MSAMTLYQRACEVVHHEHDCPAIGGRGDSDCQCDGVPFLRDLESHLTAHAQMVEKVRSIIDTLRDYDDHGLADKLAAAIGDKP
jgi:hypothetical protein